MSNKEWLKAERLNLFIGYRKIISVVNITECIPSIFRDKAVPITTHLAPVHVFYIDNINAAGLDALSVCCTMTEYFLY